MKPIDDGYWDVATPREARARLVDALRLELLGPWAADETLTESPLTRYVTGMLAPFGTGVPEEEQDEALSVVGDEEENGAVELDPPMSQAITPSSIGLSVLVPGGTRQLVVAPTWGDYRRELAEGDEEDSPEPEEAGSSGDGDLEPEGDSEKDTESPPRRRPRNRWVRTPRDPTPLTIDLRPDAGLMQERVFPDDDVEVEHLTRTVGEQLAVSVFLVNRRPWGTGHRPPVDHWLFQPRIWIGPADEDLAFMPRDLEPALDDSDRDRESNRLLFRGRREFAVGHGCATDWKEEPEIGRSSAVWSVLIPAYELPRVDPRAIAGQGLEMAALASAESGDEILALLSPLLGEYEAWLSKKKKAIRGLPADLRAVAASHVEEGELALKRMRDGVTRLTQDPEALRAFRFANHAMLLQRSHVVWAQARRSDPASAPVQAITQGRWHPFQLAFFLLNLSGLIDPTSEDREVGDLLWFPTGGGKTEAYLGLAAFTMALRRRRSRAGMRTDAGLAVLMRYTLRLLTLQQFQRASTLLCACEVLRADEPETWGDTRFTIGLWLGMKGTPNRHDDARHSLTRLQVDPAERGANPCQLESCPWCGETITPDDYWTEGAALRTRVACPRNGCAFSRPERGDGIPVLVVDEEIYRECPSMLLATVDKFAQMPWNGDVQALFGFVNRECDTCGFLTPATEHTGHGGAPGPRQTERLAPPDLIIQDELHLISGPLGTLVGLYETAVDFLCTWQKNGKAIRPKVIASTATVRRAFEQVQALFGRKLKVFPPPGLEPEDSFFAIEQPVNDEVSGRLYLGVCAPGKSMKTAYVRVAASLLSSVEGLVDTPELAEPYKTLVSYFNSLRELGGAIRLLDDDIPGRLYQLTDRGLPKRARPVYRELTSRIRQEDIPNLLRQLEQRHDAPRTDEDPLPLDAVLASNMISVGVDVDRLGLMAVVGQPKTTAEYIQASSRVGRQVWGPGLVVTLYNWSRPRDLSHYERFRHYHSTLYRNVEAVSATPFSTRALDRGLRGAYVAMTRLGSEGWSPELGAGRFDPKHPRVTSVMAAFRQRAEVVAGSTIAAGLAQALSGVADEWWGFRTAPLRYGWRSRDPKNDPDEDVLLRVPEGGRIGHWPAPQSLREVEELSAVRVLDLRGR